MIKSILIKSLIASAILTGCGASTKLKPVSDPAEQAVIPKVHLQKASVERQLSTITVRVRNLSCKSISRGSGFAVSPRTLITNHHVVDGAKQLEINTWDGKSIKAKIDSASTYGDIAIVRVNTDLENVSESTGDPKPGTAITVAGYPLGGELALSKGKVVGYLPKEDSTDGIKRMVVNAKIKHGNSGGPVVNAKGKVVGVIVELDKNNNGYAIPSSEIAKLKSSLSDTEIKPCQYDY